MAEKTPKFASFLIFSMSIINHTVQSLSNIQEEDHQYSDRVVFLPSSKIVYDVTKRVHDDFWYNTFKDIGFQMSSPFFYEIKDSDYSTCSNDFSSCKENTISGISILANTGVENLRTTFRGQMTVDKALNITKTTNLSLHSLIFLAQPKDGIYCTFINKNVLQFLTENRLRITDSERQMNYLSVKLGLEVRENLVEKCVGDSTMDTLKQFDFIILQVGLNVKSGSLTYEEFVKKWHVVISKYRNFVLNNGPHCKMYIKVGIDDWIGIEMSVVNRFHTLVDSYIRSWIEKEGGKEIYILRANPKNIFLDKNSEMLKNKISPLYDVFAEFQNFTNIESVKYKYFGHHTNGVPYFKEVTIKIYGLESFRRAVEILNEFVGLRFNVILSLNKNTVSVNQEDMFKSLNLNVSVTQNFEHINVIYFATESWNDSQLTSLTEIFSSVGMHTGCYIRIYPQIPDSIMMSNIRKQCGFLLNDTSEVLIDISLNVTQAETMLINTLIKFNKLKINFYNSFSNKTLTPMIMINEAPVVLSSQNELEPELVIRQGAYCNEYLKRVNGYYESIITFANVYEWPRLVLRPVLDSTKGSGWWRSIYKGFDIDPSITNFSILVRNYDVASSDNTQLPMTYKCINWTQKPQSSGVAFDNNRFIGTTIHINLKRQAKLRRAELEMMMLFALGTFSSVEFITDDATEYDLALSTLSTSLLSAIKESPGAEKLNKIFAYLEIPISNEILLSLQQIKEVSTPNNVALHFKNWEQFYERDDMNFNDILRLSQTNLHKMSLGLSVNNCSHEINLKLKRMKSLPFFGSLNYVVCNIVPVLPSNTDLRWMKKYFDTLFYIKSYIEKFVLHEKVSVKPFEIIFRINILSKHSNCESDEKGTANFLRFLNDLSQHSVAYKIRYFLVRAFEQEGYTGNCVRSWWHLEHYDYLTNTSVYIGREDEYFNRSTKQPLHIKQTINYDLGDKSSNQTKSVVIGIVCMIVIFLLLIILRIWIKLHRTKRLYFLTKGELRKFYNGEDTTEDQLSNQEGNDWESLKFSDSFELRKRSIELGQIIGSGQFGVVHYGMLSNHVEIAVKIPKANGDKTVFKNALAEVKLLCYVGRHSNVVAFLGAYTKEIEKGIVYIVTEFCANGSLEKLLRKMQRQQMQGGRSYVNLDQSSNQINLNVAMQMATLTMSQYVSNENTLQIVGNEVGNVAIDFYELCKFSHQIATGMEYIASKRIIHADLATRNILLTKDYTCKIGDFGLSRRLYEMNEYVKTGAEPMPWRWMAPESLTSMQFTSKSDVWSYGITVWEIFSLGTIPYPGLSWSSEFVVELENGMRMGKARYASDKIHDELLNCWNSDPENRPSFENLAKLFLNLQTLEYASL